MPIPNDLIPIERIASRIFLIRNEKVMIDSDLGEMYGVTTGNLNKAVKRNIRRFPEGFMFQLNKEEYEALIFQNGISKKEGRGGRRKLPSAFTEQGVAMLSSVLRSDRAADVNVAIMRAFVRMRKLLATHEELAKKVDEHDHHIATLYEYVQQLLEKPNPPERKKIGYV